MEEKPKQFIDLTVSDILKDALGDKSEEILSEIRSAIDTLRDEALNQKIHEILCKNAVYNIEVYNILFSSLKTKPPQPVIPGDT